MIGWECHQGHCDRSVVGFAAVTPLDTSMEAMACDVKLCMVACWLRGGGRMGEVSDRIQ